MLLNGGWYWMAGKRALRAAWRVGRTCCGSCTTLLMRKVHWGGFFWVSGEIEREWVGTESVVRPGGAGTTWLRSSFGPLSGLAPRESPPALVPLGFGQALVRPTMVPGGQSWSRARSSRPPFAALLGFSGRTAGLVCPGAPFRLGFLMGRCLVSSPGGGTQRGKLRPGRRVQQVERDVL